MVKAVDFIFYDPYEIFYFFHGKVEVPRQFPHFVIPVCFDPSGQVSLAH